MNKENKMIRERIIFKGFFFVLVLSLLINFSSCIVLAGENKDLLTVEDIEICLDNSEKIMREMQSNGFNIARINDTLSSAKDIFEVQLSLKESGRTYNLQLIFGYCEDISKIKENADNAAQELEVLMRFYYSSFDGERIDTSSVDILLEEIKSEIDSERYELVFPLIDKTYQEISNVKSSHTTLMLFYDSTTRGLKRFLTENWIVILSFISALLFLYILFKKPILKSLLNTRLQRLELRKNTLKSIIQKNQKEYFETGVISENEFNIKNKKLGEMIRDIDRQLPLLREEILKLNKKK